MNVERISNVAHFLADPKRLQLLAELDRRPLDHDALEERLDLEPLHLARLLRQLSWFGFVERTPTGSAWRLANGEVRALVRALLGLDGVSCSRADVVVPLLRGGARAPAVGSRRPLPMQRGAVRR